MSSRPEPKNIQRLSFTGAKLAKKVRLVGGGVLVLLVVHVWFTYRIHCFVDHFCQATINETSLSHPDVVMVHDDLLQPLKEELEDGYRISVRPYDAFAFDFSRCTHSAIITTANQERGIRLRFDFMRNRFHVVGFWTIR